VTHKTHKSAGAPQSGMIGVPVLQPVEAEVIVRKTANVRQ